MSVEGQDERIAKAWEQVRERDASVRYPAWGGPFFKDGFFAGYRAALVGSEARERELVEIAAKERGHAAWHLDRALKAEAREREWREKAEYRRQRFAALAEELRTAHQHEAVLVEALKEAEGALKLLARKGWGGDVGEPEEVASEALARLAALAGVVGSEVGP